MKHSEFVSVFRGQTVKMRLHAGLTYQKVVNEIGLTDPEGNPLIDTLERDIEAFLIGEIPKPEEKVPEVPDAEPEDKEIAASK